MAKNKLAGAMSSVITKEVARRTAEDRALFGGIAIKLITSASMVVLHDEFGFGPKRLQKFQSLVEEQCECVSGGYCSIEDLKQLADELAKKVGLYEVNNIGGETDEERG